MTAMPISDQSTFDAGNQVMQVHYDYNDKAALATRDLKSERRATSPNSHIDIFAGGWDDESDDNEDDYVDMAPVQPQRSRSATHSPSPAHSHPRASSYKIENSPNRVSASRNQAPEVVVLSASPHNSIACNASLRTASRPQSLELSCDSGSDSSRSDSGEQSNSEDSEKNQEDGKKNTRESEILNRVPKQRTSSRTSIPLSDVLVSTPPPTPPRRQASTAGQAAIKYLQMQQAQKCPSRSQYEPLKSSSGLTRSSSRVGTRGVQSRISNNKKSSHQAAVVRSQSVKSLGPSEGQLDRAASDSKINEAKQKSRTLDRSLRGVKNLGVDTVDGSEDRKDIGDDAKRQSNDGAAVVKMISDRRRKSQSLDSKYLHYLDEISKHASAPNSPGQDTLEKDNKQSKRKNKKKSKDAVDEEGEFQKYAQTMATKTRGSLTGSSSELSTLKSDSIGRNLAEFAKEKAKADKYAKKKLQASAGLASKFSFRKSKTLGKADFDVRLKINFSESAQAFHEQLKRENSLPDESVLQAESSQVKSNSLKREKRKSWRKKHGFSLKPRSKERINLASTSTITTEGINAENVTGKRNSMDRSSKGQPQIKQSLGYKPNGSPSLRRGNGSSTGRERATPVDTADTPTHSPKIMSPATARSMTLDHRNAGITGEHMIRGGSIGQLTPHPSLKHMNSLNSETSGSNSDLSIVLDEEFDELKVGRSGTLSRLLGRKVKTSKIDGAEFEESEAAFYSTGSLGRRKNKRGKYATLGSPAMALRMRQANSREALLETKPFDPIDMFFHPRKFVRGFRIINQDEEEEDEDNEMNGIGLTFESTRVNKYETITSGRMSPHRNSEHGHLRKRVSDSTFEASRRITDEASARVHRRNQSLPEGDVVPQRTKSTKGKGFGSAISRTLQRGSAGPSNHLSFGDVLTENEVVVSSNERHGRSPLQTRKVQVIEPLLEEPSLKILSAARTIYHHLQATRPDLLQLHSAEDERENYGVYEHTVPEPDLSLSYPNSFFGQELVTWLIGEMPSAGPESSSTSSSDAEIRQNVCGMMQALVEEGAISHVRRERHFQDTYLLYQFHESVTKPDDHCGRPVSAASTVSSSTMSSDLNSTTSLDANDTESQNEDSAHHPSRAPSVRSAQTEVPEHWVPSLVDEQKLKEVLSFLQNVAPDAMFRMVLSKLPDDRTTEELMMIYEEILHIKALAHLSDSVKRELAGVLKFEFHSKNGKTLFSQGDEGRSWYIIVKGSVDVDIQGQGVVCTLHEGDDFGNLAIINDAPRAATIVLAEDNCQLLRVDKNDFVRILKDVEANTVRLKEHDKDVLILQKIHARSSSTTGRQDKFFASNTKANQRLPAAATPTRNSHRYAISAGTSTKIVEHIVKSLRPWSTAKQSDEAMEDLILMYQVFMTTQELCKYLMNLYQSEKSEQIDSTKSIKRKVVYFVVRWSHIANHIFYDQPAVGPFLKELKQAVSEDNKMYPNLKEDLARIYALDTPSSDSPSHRGWITVESTTVQRYPVSDSTRAPHRAIKANDDVMLKVFNANGTYTTVRLPVISSVTEIISAVAEKQSRDATDLQLIQVQSDGDMYVLPKKMTSAATSVGVNNRHFICSTIEKDDIAPLEEQRALPSNNSTVLELVGTQEIAEHITQFDWELVNSIHVMEFVHKVFGSHKFHSVTSNIDVFARRFNQLAYWAPTEICACNNVNKRVHLLRKFIKIAQHLKELQNMNAFMAVMIGLGNQALSRLHGTWDKLPTKYKKLMTEYEAVLDPSRNHRAYRLYVASLRPPLIPYLPLLMKDMTFQHEGNDSMRNGLINFEKMHMMSNTIRGVIQACSKPLEMSHTVITSKTFDDTRRYTRGFGVITDQKFLNQISGRVEAKR